MRSLNFDRGVRLLAGLLCWGMLTSTAFADVIYSVRDGDTVATIAKAFGLTEKEVVQANPAVAEGLEIGMVLMLPEKEEAPENKGSVVDDPIILAGVTHDPPKATQVELEEDAANRRRFSMSSRAGRVSHSLLATARRFIGVPYRMGGTTSRAFDCSGYVMRVYAMHGITLPRTADVQYNVGQKVPRGEELPGDLVFFETYLPGPSHVGIYMGNNNFIHASSSRGVTISSLNKPYYRNRYLGAKRVIK